MDKDIKYLEAFKKLSELRESIEIIGDVLLVQMMPIKEAKTKGGLYMAPTHDKRQIDSWKTEQPVFVRVLAIGEGYYDETGNTIPLNVSVGDVCLVGQHSIKQLSMFGDIVTYGDITFGVTREAEIQVRFKGEEGYR